MLLMYAGDADMPEGCLRVTYTLHAVLVRSLQRTLPVEKNQDFLRRVRVSPVHQRLEAKQHSLQRGGAGRGWAHHEVALRERDGDGVALHGRGLGVLAALDVRQEVPRQRRLDVVEG
eukprot:61246-Prorocentrum_minimum.AAC.4